MHQVYHKPGTLLLKDLFNHFSKPTNGNYSLHVTEEGYIRDNNNFKQQNIT